MNINVIVLGLMSLLAGFYAWKAYFHVGGSEAPSMLPWVPIDVRKNKVYVSQTRDASMFTERSRRLAVLTNKGGSVSYKGSTNGYLEYALSAICYCPGGVCPPAPNVVWSSGDADDEICDIVDAGGALGMYDEIDFGGAEANDCDV